MKKITGEEISNTSKHELQARASGEISVLKPFAGNDAQNGLL
jgi:hypothetical protein